MIENIVRYLHGARVPFRLTSYPNEEAEPRAAHRLPAEALLVDTAIFVLEGRAVLTCFPSGEHPDAAAVGAVLGAFAVEGTTGDLPDEYRYSRAPVPPLGQLLGMPVVADERVTTCAVLAFRAFGEDDYFEIPYEDFARLEQPRVASFASAGALGSAVT